MLTTYYELELHNFSYQTQYLIIQSVCFINVTDGVPLDFSNKSEVYQLTKDVESTRFLNAQFESKLLGNHYLIKYPVIAVGGNTMIFNQLSQCYFEHSRFLVDINVTNENSIFQFATTINQCIFNDAVFIYQVTAMSANQFSNFVINQQLFAQGVRNCKFISTAFEITLNSSYYAQHVIQMVGDVGATQMMNCSILFNFKSCYSNGQFVVNLFGKLEGSNVELNVEYSWEALFFKQLNLYSFGQLISSQLSNCKFIQQFIPGAAYVYEKAEIFVVAKEMISSKVFDCTAVVRKQVTFQHDTLNYSTIYKALSSIFEQFKVKGIFDFRLSNSKAAQSSIAVLFYESTNMFMKNVSLNVSCNFINLKIVWEKFGTLAIICNNCSIQQVLSNISYLVKRKNMVQTQFILGGLFAIITDSTVSHINSKTIIQYEGEEVNETVTCFAGIVHNSSLSYSTVLCQISILKHTAQLLTSGIFGYVQHSAISFLMCQFNGSVITSDIPIQQSFIGTISQMLDSSLQNSSFNISFKCVGSAVFAGIISFAKDSSIQLCFSHGNIESNNSNKRNIISGLVGILVNTSLSHVISNIEVVERDSKQVCFNGVGQLDTISVLRQVVCYQTASKCMDPSNLCYPRVLSSQIFNSFGICSNMLNTFQTEETCFCIYITGQPNSCEDNDPAQVFCKSFCLLESRLHDKKYVFQVLQSDIFHLESGVNQEFPCFNSLWNIIQLTKYSIVTLNKSQRNGIVQYQSNGVLILRNPPNLCIDQCYGVFSNLFDKYYCQVPFSPQSGCSTVNCVNNPCVTPSACNQLLQVCSCVNNQFGNLCQNNKCQKFPMCQLCNQVQEKSIIAYRCQRSGFCQTAACDICANDYYGDFCLVSSCNCTSGGTCLNNVCICSRNYIYFENRCLAITIDFRGQCIQISDSLVPIWCLECVNGFGGVFCGDVSTNIDLCSRTELLVNQYCVTLCQQNVNCHNGQCQSDKITCLCDNDFVFSELASDCFSDIHSNKGKCYLNETISQIQCVQCILNYTLQNYQCQICSFRFVNFNNLCILQCNFSSDCNGQTCLSSGFCSCDIQYTGPYCSYCSSGYVMNQNQKCQEPCSSFNCQYGDCISPIICKCSPGYVGVSCDSYYCSQDSSIVNTCRGFGKCTNNKCFCFIYAMLDDQGNCQALPCYDVINGNCSLTGQICYSGFSDTKCQHYDCRADTETQCNSIGLCDRATGNCDCSPVPYSLYNGTCLPNCDKDIAQFLILQQPFRTKNNISIGGVFQTDAKFAIKFLCTIKHAGCACSLLGICSCNKYVAYSKNKLNLVIPYGCIPGRFGNDCKTCLIGQKEINELCYFSCSYCNGDCYLHPLNNNVFCYNCAIGYDGADCMSCTVGFINNNGFCFQQCTKCNGDCYYLNISIDDSVLCRQCNPFFNISTNCLTCNNSYIQVGQQCMKLCNNCSGTCYLDGTDFIFCIDCLAGFVGQQCDRCTSGYVMISKLCQPIVQGNNGDCAVVNGVLICVSCYVDFILNLADQLCYPKCILNECLNGDCFNITDDQYKCQKCHSGFVLQNDQCWLIIENNNGNCIQFDQTIICQCSKWFSGELCLNCSLQAINISGKCGLECVSCHGDCYEFYDGSLFCRSCQQGYDLPFCIDCIFGYKQNSISGLCTDCDGNAISGGSLNSPLIQSNSCVVRCVDCLEGTCYHNGYLLICITCSDGNDIIFNCQQCQVGYKKVGNICVLFDIDCFTYQISKICFQCRNNLFCSECSSCASNSELVGSKCLPKPFNIPGSSYILGNKILSNQAENDYCIFGEINETDISCTMCSNDLVSIEGKCYYNKQSQTSLYQGDCYLDYYLTETLCLSCNVNFVGQLCEKCQSGYERCYQSVCCKIIETQAGYCYFDHIENDTFCMSCYPGFSLTEKSQCVQSNSNFKFYLIILIVIIIIIFLLLLCFFIIYKFCNHLYVDAKRKILIVISNIGMQALMIIFAQLISIAQAFQDMFLSSLTGYSLSQFISAIPYFCIFIFLEPLTFRRLTLYRQYDSIGFMIVAFMETAFQLTLYYVLPVPLQVSEQLFKALAAPLGMTVFIFLTYFKFMKQQIYTVVWSISGAVIFLIAQLFIQAFSNVYFFQSESVMSLLQTIPGVLLLALTIVIQLSLQNVMLNQYTELQALGRQSLFAILITGCILLNDMTSVIDLISYKFNEVLISVILQFFIPLGTLIVIKRLKPVEVFINLATSAVWVSFFLESVSTFVAHDFSLSFDSTNLIFSTLAILLVFVGLGIFYLYQNKFFSRHNDLMNQSPEALHHVMQETAQTFVEQIEINQISQQVTRMNEFKTQVLGLRTLITSNQLSKQSTFATLNNYFSQRRLPQLISLVRTSQTASTSQCSRGLDGLISKPDIQRTAIDFDFVHQESTSSLSLSNKNDHSLLIDIQNV